VYKKWIDSLSKVELFANIETNELNRMLTCLCPNPLSYKKGEFVALAGDEFTGVGIIVEGEVFVTKENAAGDKIILAKLGEGNIFGEMIAFSDKEQWLATVIAATDCTIYFLSPDKILGNCFKMCIGHSMLIENMVRIVSNRALLLNKQVEYLALKSIRAKISTYLLEQYKTAGESIFNIPLKRKELAAFLNVSRTSLSREIAKMKVEGVIDFYRSTFKILDINALKKSAAI